MVLLFSSVFLYRSREEVKIVKKTPLYEVHKKSGGRIVDFGGWALPVQYTGIIEEHLCVRERAGLFDVSHMGEIRVYGPDAQIFIQNMVTNDISTCKAGKVTYSPMCYPDGGVVDDLIVYKFNHEDFLLVVNAANTDKDYDWLVKNCKGRVEIVNVSENFAQLALQGPEAEYVLQKLTDKPLAGIGFFCFLSQIRIGNIKALISRTGYTGEDGFEIYLDPKESVEMWEELIKSGAEKNVLPAGLGARDTLRFEAALPLYGHEISEKITPLEAGLSKFVKLKSKSCFIGKDALVQQKRNGLRRKIVAFEMIERGLPRENYDVEINGEKTGFVTTGGYSPSLKTNIGLALIPKKYAKYGKEIGINIRGKVKKAKIIRKPFYNKKYKK